MKPADNEKRSAFRIDDALPVIIRKIDDSASISLGVEVREDFETLTRMAAQDDGINPLLWKMLIHLNNKIDRILEKMPIDIFSIKAQTINLSANGMRIEVVEKFNVGEEVRVKILLPTLPVSEIIIDAKVARATPLESGGYDLALVFQDLEEDVRDELIQYSLKQQRKALMSQRQKRV